jgi:predicted metal-dependent enzyme (double-stranded beta helix superfamily)
MIVRDWLINTAGEEEVCDQVGEFSSSTEYYRLYHFLSDLESVLKKEADDRQRLAMIRPLVRRLLTSSYWIQDAIATPDPQTGWSLTKLYDEPFFPWTIQNSAWSPGQSSPIHNHGTWGIVAVIRGQEHNTFWRKTSPDSLEVERTGECVLSAGDVISFLPQTIHSIKALGEQPAITMKVYGQMTEEVSYFEQSSLDRHRQAQLQNVQIEIASSEGFLL